MKHQKLQPPANAMMVWQKIQSARSCVQKRPLLAMVPPCNFTGLRFGGLGLLPPEAGAFGGVLGTTPCEELEAPGIPLRLSGIAVCMDVCCTRM